jgi:allantoicase
MGNFPESCQLHATAAAIVDKDQCNVEWIPILSRKLHPNRRHFSTLENVQGRVFTHVKLTIYPDGGVKRVRIIGRRADTGGSYDQSLHRWR